MTEADDLFRAPDYSVKSDRLCRLYLDKRMTEVSVRHAHEIVGRILLLRQHPIFDFCVVAASAMLTYGGPSVPAALKEFSTACCKDLKYALTRSVQGSYLRMGVRVDDNQIVKDRLHVCSTGDRWVNRQLRLKNSNIRAVGGLT